MTGARRRVAIVAALAALALHALLWLPVREPADGTKRDPHTDGAGIVHLRVRLGVASTATPATRPLPLPLPLPLPSLSPVPVPLPVAPAERSTSVTRAPSSTPLLHPAPSLAPSPSAGDVATRSTVDAARPEAGASPARGQSLDAPPPLDLQVRPAFAGPARRGEARGGRNPALDEPGGGGRLSADERFAAGFVGVAVPTQEVLADGTIRLRAGTSCLLAHPSRNAGLDPYNTALRPIPRHVQAC